MLRKVQEVHVSSSAVAEPVTDRRYSAVLEARAEKCKEGPRTGGAEAQDLVKASREDNAAQILAEEYPAPFRLRLGRLSIAQDERLHLVDRF